MHYQIQIRRTQTYRQYRKTPTTTATTPNQRHGKRRPTTKDDGGVTEKKEGHEKKTCGRLELKVTLGKCVWACDCVCFASCCVPVVGFTGIHKHFNQTKLNSHQKYFRCHFMTSCHLTRSSRNLVHASRTCHYCIMATLPKGLSPLSSIAVAHSGSDLVQSPRTTVTAGQSPWTSIAIANIAQRTPSDSLTEVCNGHEATGPRLE